MSCDCCGDNSYALTNTTGYDGIYGGYSSEWKFEASVAAGATAGYFRFNNATLASVTEIYVSDTNSVSVDVDKVLDSFSNSSVYGLIRVFKEYDPTIVWYGSITSVTDNGTYHTLVVTWVDSNGTFAAPDNCVITFTPRGTTGATGATGTSGTAGKGMFLSFTQDPEVPYVQSSADAAYVDIATILWPGSTNVGTFTVIKAVAWTSNAASAANFKIIDETNTTTIAEQVGVTSTSDANIISFTTVPLANLTTGAAVWRVQAYNTGGADQARLGAISAY